MVTFPEGIRLPLSIDQEILACLKRIEVLLANPPVITKVRVSDEDRKLQQKQSRQGRD